MITSLYMVILSSVDASACPRPQRRRGAGRQHPQAPRIRLRNTTDDAGAGVGDRAVALRAQAERRVGLRDSRIRVRQRPDARTGIGS